MKHRVVLFLGCLWFGILSFLSGGFCFGKTAEIANLISLETLLQRVETLHPSVQKEFQKTKGLQKIANVSGNWPNMKLNYQREQLFPAVGRDMIGLQFQIPLGGRTSQKGKTRRREAKEQTSYLRWIQFQAKASFLRQFYQWQFVKRKQKVNEEVRAQFHNFRKVLSSRVKGGSLPSSVLLQFDLELELQLQQVQSIQAQAQALQKQLAFQVRLPASRIQEFISPILPKTKNPRKATLQGKHPFFVYLKARIATSRSKIKHAKSLAWPDLQLSLAYLRQEPEITKQLDQHGFVVGVSIPLPFFQRNQAGIQRSFLQKSLSLLLWKQNERAWLFEKKQRLFFWKQAQTRYNRFQKKIDSALPPLFVAAQSAFLGGGSFASFLSTFRTFKEYQLQKWILAYEVRKQYLGYCFANGLIPKQQKD